MTNTTENCVHCKTTRNPETDSPFVDVTVNPEVTDLCTSDDPRIHFCSTECMIEFWAKPENEPLLALFPEQIDPDANPEAVRMNVEHRQNFIEGGPRVCAICCDQNELRERAEKAQKEKLGAYYRVMDEAEAHYALLASVMGVKICSVTCLRQHFSNLAESYDAKGYWTSREAPRCTQCREIFRTDDYGDVDLGGGMLLLSIEVNRDNLDSTVAEEEFEGEYVLLSFCGGDCLASFLEDESHLNLLRWVPKDDMHSWNCNCEQCDPEAENDHPGPFLELEGPYGSIWDGLNGPSYLCSVECLIAAAKADAEASKKHGLGKWYSQTRVPQNDE